MNILALCPSSLLKGVGSVPAAHFQLAASK